MEVEEFIIAFVDEKLRGQAQTALQEIIDTLVTSASNEGYHEGNFRGYDLGSNEGYGLGYNEGYGLGYNKGYNKGYDVGYDVGYSIGYKEAAEL